jgi:hypothetical protein
MRAIYRLRKSAAVAALAALCAAPSFAQQQGGGGAGGGGNASLNAPQTFTAAQAVQPSALTSGSTITPVFSASNNFAVTLGTNAMLANPSSGIVAGTTYHFIVAQDGTGSRTLAYGSNYKWPGGTAPTLSTAAGAIDMISCYVNDTSHFLCGAVLNFE